MLANRGDHGEVDAPVLRVEAEFHGAHARVAQGGAPAHALVGVDELAARRVREDPVALAAEEAPDRFVPRAPDEIPDRHLGDPVAPVVEVDRLDDPVDCLRVGDVEAEQQPLEQLAVRQRVAARVALDAVVRADDRDRRFLGRSWLRVPGGEERRLEWVSIPPRLDGRDLHSPE